MDLTETNAASRSAAICLEDVCVTYRRGDIFVNAVRGVNLEIMVGDFVSIEGPSGTIDDIRAPSTLTPLADRRIGAPHTQMTGLHCVENARSGGCGQA